MKKFSGTGVALVMLFMNGEVGFPAMGNIVKHSSLAVWASSPPPLGTTGGPNNLDRAARERTAAAPHPGLGSGLYKTA